MRFIRKCKAWWNWMFHGEINEEFGYLPEPVPEIQTKRRASIFDDYDGDGLGGWSS